MRKIFFILAMVAALAFAGPAMAKKKDGGNQGNQNRCHNVAGFVIDCSETTNIDNSIENNSSAKSVVNFDFDNDIDMDQKQKQKQGQLQLQGQGQLQGQKAEANNAGNTQETDIVIEGDTYEAKPNHIQGPALVAPDAKFSDTKEFSFRVLGSVWRDVDGLSSAQAKNLGIDVSDVKIDRALLTSMSAQKYISKGKPAEGVIIGTLYVYPIGAGVTLAGLEGIAAESAMGYGATHMVIVFDFGVEASGSAWNVGIGGGASIVANASGTVMVAPNGGLGFGKAKASNISLPALVVKLYRNELSAKANEVK